VTYLDTGCFVKLYYPEADSAQVIAHKITSAIQSERFHVGEYHLFGFGHFPKASNRFSSSCAFSFNTNTYIVP
jgi:hypothetical protein